MALFLINSISAEGKGPSTRARESKKYNLSICALFKNEARCLKEWIEYHLLVGVDHFYLYNNGSKDRFFDILNPYIKKGVVSLVNWPSLPGCSEDDPNCLWVLSTQIAAYENATNFRAVNETKWLVILDVNEFLVPTEAGKLTEVLEKYKEYPGIMMPMDFYDASKTDALPRRKLLVETVELVGPQLNPPREVAKTIFKPEFCAGFTWPPYKCLFKTKQGPVRLKKHELRINRYVNRFKGHIGPGKLREKLDVDNRLLSEEEMSELFAEDYEIADQERIIHRFIPQLLKKLGYEMWDF